MLCTKCNPNENMEQTEKARNYLASKTASAPERSLPAGIVIRPRCWIENEALFYEFESSLSSTASHELVLWEFIKLSKGSVEEIGKVANRYGPLMLCKAHQLPVFSSAHPSSRSKSAYCPPLYYRREADDPPRHRSEGCEPLSGWRAWSKRPRSLSYLQMRCTPAK
jgi:hypothetical protein